MILQNYNKKDYLQIKNKLLNPLMVCYFFLYLVQIVILSGMLRSVFFILFFTTSFSYYLSAQSLPGIKTGLNYSSYVGLDASNYIYKPSYFAGVYWKLSPMKFTNFQLELLISQKGAAIDVSDIDSLSENKTDLLYIDFPLLIIINQKNLSFSTGLEPSFLLKATQYVDVVGEDVELFYKPFSISFLAGANYEFNNGINFGARFEYGLFNLLDEVIVGEVIVHSINFQLSMGYTIGKKSLIKTI